MVRRIIRILTLVFFEYHKTMYKMKQVFKQIITYNISYYHGSLLYNYILIIRDK